MIIKPEPIQTAHTASAKNKLLEEATDSHFLGQFIPLHYHHNMLTDENRMSNFKAAIDQIVFAGAKVLELGGGTGVLSCLAAAKAGKVWCVEYNPDLVAESRRFLALNSNGHKVEVIHADAFEYLPPEPVDVVICEMIHVAMLREKQIEMIENFKLRYLQRHGGPLPVFIPEATGNTPAQCRVGATCRLQHTGFVEGHIAQYQLDG
jgi:protein arginine N-methyltransferase 1